MPGLKGDQIPELPGGVGSVFHQAPDQGFDDGRIEDPLLPDPLRGEIGVDQ